MVENQIQRISHACGRRPRGWALQSLHRVQSLSYCNKPRAVSSSNSIERAIVCIEIAMQVACHREVFVTRFLGAEAQTLLVRSSPTLACLACLACHRMSPPITHQARSCHHSRQQKKKTRTFAKEGKKNDDESGTRTHADKSTST
jgi:hypothetical protein